MGNSLHNKIYLGRRGAVLDTKRKQAMLCIGAALSIALTWLLIEALR